MKGEVYPDVSRLFDLKSSRRKNWIVVGAGILKSKYFPSFSYGEFITICCLQKHSGDGGSFTSGNNRAISGKVFK